MIMEHYNFAEEKRFLEENREELMAYRGGILADKFIVLKGRHIYGVFDSIENAAKARMSQKLVRLDAHAPIETEVSEFGVCDPDAATLIPFLKAMEFATLIKRDAFAALAGSINP